MQKCIVGIAFTCVSLFSVSSASAATLRVPGSYGTIDQAIIAANNGDQVVIAPGTYWENVSFRGKAITVRSTRPYDPQVVAATVIDGQRKGAVVAFTNSEGSLSVLKGLTIKNGSGIWCWSSSPTITLNVITGSSTSEGGGIYCYSSCRATIFRNTITGNHASKYGGGIYCGFGASPRIERNIISANGADLGGGIYCWKASPTIVRNTIDGNSVSLYGGGIDCALSSPTIDRNTITGNSASDGGGIWCHNDAAPRISRNVISGNRATHYGGGIFCDWGCSPTIEGNTIKGNSATGTSALGGGIYCTSGSPNVVRNTITGNSAQWSGGGVFCYYASPDISKNTISDNSARGHGGGICYDHCTATASGNIINGNSSDQSGGGIFFGDSPLTLSNNTISGNSARDRGGGIYCWSSSPTILNCIVTFARSSGGIEVSPTSHPAISYCDVYGNVGGNYVGITDPTGTNGNISIDPVFANTAAGDFHLKSRRGRWKQSGRTWVTDGVHSPAIDAGDPTSDCSAEPAPNGHRANMGAYGNTRWASKSYILPRARPDMMIRNRGQSSYVGGNVYNRTGVRQKRCQRVARGVRAVYHLRVQNDGKTPTRFRICGPGGDDKWRVEYFDRRSGGARITGSVTGPGWITPSLGSRGTRALRLEVTPLAGVALRAQKIVLVTATAADGPTKTDAVKAVTTAVGGTSTYQVSSLAAVPTPTGAQIAFSLSSSAEVDVFVMNIAGRPVKTLCHARDCEAGANTLIWNAQSDQGLPVPNGTYLVEVCAKAEDGGQARALTRVRINR